MKTIATTQRNTASTLHAHHSTHNVHSPLRRLTLLVTLLMTFALGARAAEYVITYTNGGTTYFLANTNNDNTPDAVTSFNPTTCIWEGDNGGKFRNNGRYLVGNNNNNTLTLTNSQNNGTNWTVNGNNLYFQSRSEGSIVGTFYYYRGIRYNNGVWETVESNRVWNGIVAPDFDGNVDILYQVTTATVKSKTQTELDPATSTVTLTPASTKLSSVGDRAEFQATAPTITQKTYTIPEHKTYTFNNTTYYQLGSTISATEPAGNLTSSVLNPTYHWNLSSGGDTYLDAGADGGTGWVQKKANPNADTEVIVSVWAVYGDNAYTTPTTTATITVMSEKYNPTDITAEPLMLEVGGTGAISYTLKPTGAKDEITYNGYDNTIISIEANGVVTGLKAGITEATLTAKKLDNSDGPSTTSTVTVTPKAPTIEFSLGSGIIAKITNPGTNGTIYYTTNGDTPTADSTPYTDSFTVEAGVTVKAIVVVTVNDVQLASPVTESLANAGSGIIDKTVYLYDLEDHNWAYYQQPSNLPSGYPTTYLSSPNPRNVKITYRGGGVSGASAVAISALEREGQNEMVYYKTLEKSVPGMSGDYPYTVISNPFSKRPATGSGNNKTYYGFAGWKVVDGGEYISEHNDNEVLDLDETIHFTNLDNNYTPNCMSGEIIFEATWTQATVKTGSSAQSFDGGSYETNFWVLSGNNNIGNISVPANCTVSSRYPDGTVNFNRNLTGTITAGGNNAKVEFVNMNSTGNVSAANKTFTMGRGIVNSGNGGQLQGCTSDNDCVQTVKVESGKYASLRNFTNGLSSARKCDQFMILGCDYDRAKGDNDKLNITGSMYVAGTTLNLNRTSGSLYVRCHIKSGKFLSSVSIDDNDGAGGTETFYLSVGNSNTQNAGRRYLCMEGGRIAGIAGGMDEASSQSTTNKSFDLRVRGTALIDGPVYGAAEYAGAKGTRTMIFTGGTVKGWIAGGANGTQSDGGKLDGASYVYVGGKTIVDSNPEESAASNIVINRAIGGNVFGAGCGYSTGSNSGQVTLGTNVVVADDAYVERGVYGGGSYGYTTNTSNIYITGGRIGGVAGGVNGTSYSANIPGGVYGGACQNRGGTVNIYMTDGEVNGGLYGGSNNSGTIANNVTMQINGGQVGTSSASANIHGGGYGQNTRVSGNVDITLGAANQATGGVTVYGDVYGGSALGHVNGTTATNTYHTHVTMNKGTIYGSLYGGALGSNTVAANVYGPVEVKVHGGSVKATSAAGSGGVYGANNINGAPQRSVTVDIYGTDHAPAENQYALHAVYGGGNQAPYTYGSGYPKVTVHNCDNSIEYVYGGGNAAAVAATDVTIWGGDVIGNVFGGGHGYKDGAGADVEGNVNVAIKGGTIKKVFGGSNSKGNIGGTIELTIDKDGDCPMRIGEVYGGGNEAAGNAGTINIGCTGAIVEGSEGHVANPGEIGKTLEGIGAVHGGANNADIGTAGQPSDITLNINSGMVVNVFGGNNTGGSVNGNVTVNVNKDENTCGWYVGKVHGGGYGSKTSVAGNVTVNIENGTIYGDVYGGSALGKVNSNTTNTTIVNLEGGVIKGDAYGGGLGDSTTEADVNGNVIVTLNGTAFELTTTTDDKGNKIPTSGRIFGCNNINGSPKGTVLVKVLQTVARNSDGTLKDKPEKGSGVYELQAVYGGGNLAAYKPANPMANGQFTSYTWGEKNVAHVNTNKPVQVVIDGCDETSIEYVYGGGNAAATPATDVTVLGSYEIGSVFGGGNGKDKYTLDGGTTWKENLGADVGIINAAAYATDKSQGTYGTGNAMTSVLGGTVHNIFGGSNTLGNIVGEATAYLDAASDCKLNVDGIYGGGNEAYMDGSSGIQLGCIESLKEIYGGARNANVGGDINLTITSGHFGRVFGGNNLGGLIKGSITVNIEETGCNPITIGELYGCGNKAAYTTPEGKQDPTLNIRSFTSIGNVYGGGLGKEAVVEGNPTININVVKGANNEVEGWPYNDGRTIDFGDDYKVTLPVHEKGKIGAIGNVFGGGNAAEVIGNTQVNIGTETSVVFESLTGAERTKTVEGADIRGNVYGGGNQANVTGKTNVVIGK